MPARPRSGVEVPALTARIARAGNPVGVTAMWVRDRLDGPWIDEDFADRYPRDGRPRAAPASTGSASRSDPGATPCGWTARRTRCHSEAESFRRFAPSSSFGSTGRRPAHSTPDDLCRKSSSCRSSCSVAASSVGRCPAPRSGRTSCERPAASRALESRLSRGATCCPLRGWW